MNRDAAAMKMDLPFLLQDKDRHGNLRIYYRRHGLGMIRLREMPGTPEFAAEYARAAAEIAKKEPRQQPSVSGTPGSLRWVCLQYYQSGDFKHELGASTRHARKLILDRLCEKCGNKPFGMMQPHHILKHRDRFAAGGPEAGNALVKALRQLFDWGISNRHASVNPASNVPYLRSNPEGWHTWTVEEILQFEERHPIGGKARLALALLMYTGVRRSDVIKLGRQMVRDGWLRFTETKGARRRPKLREIPVLPELQAVIDASPRGDLTFLITKFGKPFTHGGFGNWFRRRCDEAGLSHCSAHGIRKAAATKAADNGATEWQLMSIFGWETTKEASRYTKKANRKRLAGEGMHLLAGRFQNIDMVAPLGVSGRTSLKASDIKGKKS
jgi:integrase